MQSVTKRRPCSKLIRLFSQRTSIRGIPKLENTSYATIRWFWSVFVVIAFIVMASVVVLLVMRYLQYDRVIKTTTRKVDRNDFPEVTVCSKLFFNSTQDDVQPYSILDAYIDLVYSQFAVHMRNKDYAQANNVLFHDMTTFSFFYKHMAFLQNRTDKLVNEYRKTCAIHVLQDNFTFTKSPQCNVRGIFNPLYLNCLAFSLPKDSSFNSSSNFEIVIDLNFANDPKNRSVDKFKIDEIYSFNIHDASYQATTVFINQVFDYPFDFNYEVPFSCGQDNEYVVELFKEIESDTILRGNKICTNDQLDFDIFGVTFSASREHVCKYLKTQENSLKLCNCFIPFLPKQGSSSMNTVSCFGNQTLVDCYTNAANVKHDVPDSSCLPSCTNTYYVTKHRAGPMFYSNFSKMIHHYMSSITDCHGHNQKYCKVLPTCILKELFDSYANATCVNAASVEGTASDCSAVRLRVNMKAMATVKTESLVVEISSLLSQISGVCAFFTGLTFTFIAEIIEAIILWKMTAP